MSQSKRVYEVKIAPEDHLATLRNCGGYYECSKDHEGRRLSPLVGYAGKYDDGCGNKEAYVGDVYYNFAKAEEYPHVLEHFAGKLAEAFNWRELGATVFLGAPMGGILFAGALGRALKGRTIFAEKKVTAIETPEKREETVLVVNRHEIQDEDGVIIVEDVCNNFSTTDKVIELVASKGGKVVAIACELNRSKEKVYKTTDCLSSLPIMSLLHIPTIQYKQHDPAVHDDIVRGNVIWKPKDEWNRLQI